MPRSIWKGPFIQASLLKKVDEVVASGKHTVIKTYSRSSTILPQMVGQTIAVYNGKQFIPVVVNEMMVGQKLGQYSPTRTYYGHGVDKKARKK